MWSGWRKGTRSDRRIYKEINEIYDPEDSGGGKKGGARLRGGNRENYQSSASLSCLCVWAGEQRL